MVGMPAGYCILGTMATPHRASAGPSHGPSARASAEASSGVSRKDAEAGCREPFVDAALYDYEYRHRRADIHFYRRLAKNRMEFASGPILDLACGTGRLLMPLVRDGHRVVGIDCSPEMLAAAAKRLARLGQARKAQCSLARADMRRFAYGQKASLALAAFHSVQHLLSEEDFLHFLRTTRTNLGKGGWLAFDVLPPDPRWLARDPTRRWGRTTLRHPVTKQRFVYTNSHVFDPRRQLLHMRLYYQPVDGSGQPCGTERVVRLCHRQFWPDEVNRLLSLGGFRLTETFAGFDGRLLSAEPEGADEHIYLAVAK
jgi:SAM-dependent methyltransferase